jgi:DNA-binding LacI/PurR family transcriptional regulator
MMREMAGITVEQSNLKLLAKRIEAEIRARGLRTGDRFMTTEEVGQMLGVSSATAHRALNSLVKRKLLIRQHGRGTFVGPTAETPSRIELQTVYILLPEEVREFANIDLDAIVDAVRQHVGRVNVQLSFLPAENGLDYVRELLTLAQRSGQFAGAIPISCTREVYRYLSETRTPTVVLGSLYRNQQQYLPSVDVDYRDAGKLLAKYLLSEGHKRIALLATSGGRPGDDAFYDGVSDALTEAALPHNALIVRTFPQDFDAFRAQIEELLAGSDRPSGIIVRSERLLPTVVATVAASGLSSPDDIDIVFQTRSHRLPNKTPYAYVRPKEPFRRIAEHLAIMLQRAREGHSIPQERVIVPVELHRPGDPSDER